MEQILGIDVGATGTKGGIVDLEKGDLVSERIKFKTPDSKKPDEMIEVINDIVNELNWEGKPIGLGFPAIIKDKKSWSASNIHKSWIGYPIEETIAKRTKSPVFCINDADAAGLAEMQYGIGRGQKGTCILLTLGTGIGSALFINGVLVPNTEFGQLYYKDKVTEYYASNSARKNFEMDWETYGKELNKVLLHIDFIFSPNLMILGGGISKKLDSYEEFLSKKMNIVAAEKLNNAGIIGAALAYYIYAGKSSKSEKAVL